MSQQKASLLLAKQGKIEVGTRAIPTPQGKQALVKVTATAINPVDWKIVDYGIFVDEFPAVLGTDGAGIIESVGPEVTGFEKGDKIFFQGLYKPADFATFQQYTLVDTEVTAKVPPNISDDQASTIPLGSVTSLIGLFQKSGIDFPVNGPTASGKSVLILGGSSSVGQFGIQLARIAGFSPIVTTASVQHTEYLKSLGATHVFDRNVDSKTLQEASGGPFSLAFDSISVPSTQKLAVEALTQPSAAPGAHLAVVLPLEAALQKELEGKVTVNQVEVGIRSIPTAGSKEVLVKVTAAAINPVDWKIIDSGIIVEEYPAVLGTDGAGIIESVGPHVMGLQKGDRIFFQGRYIPNLATFQQYALADSEMMAKIPDGISDDQASTIPVASVAAMLGLFQGSGVPLPLDGPTASGKPILILGGSSSVGQYAIQMARIAGFSPVVTTASEKHTGYLKSLGATHILDRNADAKTLQSAFPEPVSFVLDAISLPETQAESKERGARG
ncbi:hypothetical protein FRC07_002400 [Ceratobasidium sp. 392]|nr:hypothetical protein FRC07_002400 [Ceratobasidium sp. 392]